ncbi:MAG TPA: hypothetical protein VKM72_33585 [Thermoanaerobaculia bacterium]|nr:hypothetical protein [Thermoanaerobaculia bacterium]
MELEDIYRPPQADLEIQVPAPSKPLAPFFQTSPLKVTLLSIATFGLYQLYWFHKHWYRRKAHGEDVVPLARTIFAVWFAHSLFQSVNRQVEHSAQPGPSFSGLAGEPLNAGLLAVGFFACNMLWRLPDPVSFLGVFSFVPLVIAQKRINQLHAELGYDTSDGSSFTLGTITALVVGGIWWVLVVIGSLTPQA